MKKTILFLSILLFVVSCGNSKTKQVEAESPYGDWQICDYEDDFGDPTGKKYVRLFVEGRFSNSATASSRLRVIVFLTPDYNSYSGKHYISGYMKFDEYCDGTEDFHVWSDISPAKKGTKIIDKPNHKAYYYDERIGLRDKDDNSYHRWVDLICETPSTFDFTIKGDYQDEYRFTIDSEKLQNALKDAGMLQEATFK